MQQDSHLIDLLSLLCNTFHDKEVFGFTAPLAQVPCPLSADLKVDGTFDDGKTISSACKIWVDAMYKLQVLITAPSKDTGNDADDMRNLW